MKKSLRLSILLCMLSLALASCVHDDLDEEYGSFGEGESEVTMCVTFHSLSNGTLGSTRSERGDLIGSIDDVFIVWYTAEGALAGHAYYPNDQLVISDVTRPDSPTEQQTQRAELQCNIPFGRYRIYAVANMGDLSADSRYAALLGEETDFRSIALDWEDGAIGDNDQMSGYFTYNESGGTRGQAPLLTINTANPSLHAWIRRLASKVTVSFDSSELLDNIYIYIKSARIHNIPKSCTLVDPNDESRINDPEEDVWADGDEIEYGEGSDFNLWPRLTKGSNPLGGDAESKRLLHANDARSLFFFENMQGTGKLKWQDTDGDGNINFPNGNDPSDAGYRDQKPCGTYIEVEGFYISNRADNPGRGKIFYRFMLGKDTETDYNAERNFHYKLTLRFRGHANDVDWHIDYNEDPGIHAPNPYFISYLYDHSMMLPLKIKGKPVGKLTAEIIENNWKPYQAGSEFSYYTGEVYTMSGNPTATSSANAQLNSPKIKDGPWNGFLSLITTTNNWIGRDKNFWTGYNYFYWKQKDFGTMPGFDLESYGNGLLLPEEQGISPRGYREFDISESKTVYDPDGDYTVTVDSDSERVLVQIPFYTRALQLSDKTGFSGNNPYFSYRREAKVRFSVQLEGHAQPTVDTVTIFQVRRIINPKGIYRRHDNDAAFNVVLSHRLSEAASDAFVAFESEGPWDATVEVGQDWIKLNGKLNNRVTGNTGDEVRFTYQPDGTIGADQCRFGIILVRYHNYACYHRIFVRQGYAPYPIAGTAKWHCFNLCYQNTEAASPCEEGSLFRFGNIAQPIDAVNNQFDNFADHATSPFKLAPVSEGKTGTWIRTNGQTQITNKAPSSEGFGDQTQTIGGKSGCHVARYADFHALQTQCQYAFGILYDDASTETSLTIPEVYNYAYYNKSNENKGMRGCFVYNPKGSINEGGPGANLFFPVGVAGYGRRKNCAQEGGKRGVLRYANRGGQYTSDDIHYRPMFYNIYTNFGAIYWLEKSENNVTAWDINVSTYDFNQFSNNAFLVSDWNVGDVSDACFVRLVED